MPLDSLLSRPCVRAIFRGDSERISEPKEVETDIGGESDTFEQVGDRLGCGGKAPIGPSGPVSEAVDVDLHVRLLLPDLSVMVHPEGILECISSDGSAPAPQVVRERVTRLAAVPPSRTPTALLGRAALTEREGWRPRAEVGR